VSAVGAGLSGEDPRDEIRHLLDDALECYAGEPTAAARLRAQRERLDGPLRVALVGRVKAGKSTLLNALVGERLAPTDAGECTRVVTWYRHGPIPRVALHGVDGQSRVLPVHRVDGALRLDLSGTAAPDVDRLVVDWPAAPLARTTLIDTPGTASLTAEAGARTDSFVSSADAPGPDALVFLTRQFQPDDLALLNTFRTATGGAALHTTTIVVLSRADEVGSGQLDALIAAEDLARRTAEDPTVRAMGTAVVPVAGLLGLAGRMLRHRDFVALRNLASADRTRVDDMLLSADRFCRSDVPVPLSAAMRLSLLDELGLFGVRLSIALIRGGARTPDALADELISQSGLDRLQQLIEVRFAQRSATVRAGVALRTVEQVLRRHPVDGDGRVWAHLERVRLASHELDELDLLGRMHAVDGPLPRGLQDAAERLLGTQGSSPAERLGLPAGAADEEVRTAALAAVHGWRDRAGDPLARRATADACEVLARIAEGILARLDRLPTTGRHEAARDRNGPEAVDGEPDASARDRFAPVRGGSQPGA
jgi:hypothetical protein